MNGPKGKPAHKALGFVNGVAIGSIAGAAKSAPLWWPGGVPTPIVLEGLKDLNVRSARGRQVAAFLQKRMGTEAVLLTLDGETFTATKLHTKAYGATSAIGCDGTTQVGYGQRKGGFDYVALRWHGTAESIQELPSPDGTSEANAHAVDGDTIVGNWGRTGGQQACLWRAGKAIDLQSPALTASEAYDVAGDVQVGVGWAPKIGGRPYLWRGTPESGVDLTPHGAHGGCARACAANLQAGWINVGNPDDNVTHAVVWTGTAASAVDLHAHVPAPYNTSAAWALVVEGKRVLVAGEVMHVENRACRATRAVVWEGSLG